MCMKVCFFLSKMCLRGIDFLSKMCVKKVLLKDGGFVNIPLYLAPAFDKCLPNVEK